MQRKYKPFLQTNNFIKEIIIIIIAAVVPLYITATKRNYIALYIIGKNTAYKNILKRSKKNLKLNLKLLIKISLVNLIISLKNDLTNIL